MWSRFFLTMFLSAVAAVPAFAERPFPPDVKRGTMSPAPHPAIMINGKMRKLSPGARIWNTENLVEMPSSLRGSDLPVNYTENEQGDIDRVWILNRDEANQPLSK